MSTCPACSSDTRTTLYSLSAAEAAQHFILREYDPPLHDELRAHIRRLWSAQTCEICECDNCGFGYSHPYVAGDSKFYNLAFPTITYPRSRWEFLRTLDALRAMPVEGAHALEMGAGNGAFLAMLCPRLVKRENVVALEYNHAACEELKSKGYEALSEDIRSPRLSGYGGRFDFIFMFQVLEHMDRLDEVFERLRFLSSTRARIFIAVPNARRLAFNERHASLLDMPPSHIGRWTPDAFERIALRFGFELREIQREPFSALSFIKQDIAYSFIRRAQTSGSLPNRIRSLPRTSRRRVAEVLAAAAHASTRVSAWVAALRQAESLGGSLWVELGRRGSG